MKPDFEKNIIVLDDGEIEDYLPLLGRDAMAGPPYLTQEEGENALHLLSARGEGGRISTAGLEDQSMHVQLSAALGQLYGRQVHL